MSDFDFYLPALGSFLLAAASAFVSYLVFRLVKEYKGRKEKDPVIRQDDKRERDTEGEDAS